MLFGSSTDQTDATIVLTVGNSYSYIMDSLTLVSLCLLRQIEQCTKQLFEDEGAEVCCTGRRL